MKTKMLRAAAMVVCLMVGIVGIQGGGSAALAQQTFPNRAVKLLVGYAPGSSTDLVARLVANRLSQLWGQPVIVENRPGAAGNIAADHVAKSTPDGYTLLFAQNGLAISVAGNPRLQFKGEVDLLPVSSVTFAPHLLIVAPGFPAKTVPELIALAKKEPGKLTFASSGIGNSDHLAGELFNLLAGIQAVHVPYRGGSLAAQDVLGGQISYYFAGMPVGYPFAKAEKARPLAVTGSERFSGLPDVPTVAQTGLAEYEMVMWQGVFAPAGAPKPLVDKIAGDVTRLLGDPEMRERLNGVGMQPFVGTPEKFSAYYLGDIAKWRRVLQEAKVKLD